MSDTASTVIPEHLEETLLARAGELHPVSGRRWTHRELAAWLGRDHGLTCSHMAVGRCLLKLRRARSEMVGEALREALLTSLQDDWAALDLERERLAADLATVDPLAKPKVYVELLGELRKIAATKAITAARVGGVDEDGAVKINATLSVIDARTALAARLAGAAPRSVADAAVGDAGGPVAGSGGDTPA